MPSKAGTQSERKKRVKKASTKRKKHDKDKTRETIDEDDTNKKKKTRRHLRSREEASRDESDVNSRKNKKHKKTESKHLRDDSSENTDNKPKKKRKLRTYELSEELPATKISAPRLKNDGKSKTVPICAPVYKEQTTSSQARTPVQVSDKADFDEVEGKQDKSPVQSPASDGMPDNEQQKLVEALLASGNAFTSSQNNNGPQVVQQPSRFIYIGQGGPQQMAVSQFASAPPMHVSQYSPAPVLVSQFTPVQPVHVPQYAPSPAQTVSPVNAPQFVPSPSVPSSPVQQDEQYANLAPQSPATNDNEQYANLVPPTQQLPSVYVAAPKSPATRAAQPVNMPAVGPNDNDQYANLAPPEQLLPSVYVKAGGRERNQSAYLGPPPPASSFKPLVMTKKAKPPSSYSNAFP